MSFTLNDLSTGTEAYGFEVNGTINTSGEQTGLGAEVSSIGDFNSDGIDDFAVSTPGHDGWAIDRQDAGGLYIVYGGTDLATEIADGTLDLTLTTPGNTGEAFGCGLFVLGERPDDVLVGIGAGDVDGDGYDDVFMTAPSFVEVDNPNPGPGGGLSSFDHRPGTGYILYGGPSAEALADVATDTIDLANLPSLPAALDPGVTVIHGEDSALRTGLSYEAGGDLNGDGLADVALGTFQAPGILYDASGADISQPGLSQFATDGRVYAIYGQEDRPREIDLTNDIVGGNGSAGFFTQGFIETVADGPSGILPDFVGSIGFPGTLAMADLDGNGRDELIVGSAFGGELQTLPGGQQYSPGGLFVLDFGTSNASAEVTLRDQIFLQGEITGELTATGIVIENLGDVTGDGLDDVGIRAPLYDDGNSTNTGAVYGLLGDSSMFSVKLSGRTNLVSEADFRIKGNEAGDGAAVGLDNVDDPTGGGVLQSGMGGVGDVNGDGVSDFAVAFPNANDSDGSIYVVLGRTGRENGPTSELQNFDTITRFADYAASDLGQFGMSQLDGAGGELAGTSLSGPMDLNGDAELEIVVGAPGPLDLLPDGRQIPTTDGRVYIISDFFEEAPVAPPTFPGTELANLLTGTAAAERFDARGGNDWINAGGGSDTVDGGAGRDMLSLYNVPDTPGRTNVQYRLEVDMGAGTSVSHDGAERITFSGIERFTASIYADRIRGSDGDDEIRGLGDYDWFIATPGNDSIDGGTGQDMISFLEYQSSAANVIGDIFGSNGLPPTGAQVSGLVVDLADPTNNTELAAGLELTSVERVTGSVRQDVFWGDDGQNDFRGLGDFDWFVSSEGGRERYFGGNGFDTVTYFNAASGIVASLSNGATVNGQETGFGDGGVARGDLYFEIENLVGSRFGDRLTGSSERNQLNGLEGDDFIFGQGNTDYMKGGAGNDVIDGGDGADYALFSGNSTDYTLTRAGNEVTVTGADGTDRLIDVEYFRFDNGDVTIWEL